jgi:hypothetical protein
MYRDIYVEGDTTVEFDYEFDMEQILSLIEKCTKEERDMIMSHINLTKPNDNPRYNKKELYISEYTEVGFYYSLDFYELMDIINDCSGSEKEEIMEQLGFDDDKILMANNLYDEQKAKLLTEAFKIYSLEELQERLNLK